MHTVIDNNKNILNGIETINFPLCCIMSLSQVVIGRDDTIYVSDGYCNGRVAVFSPTGKYQGDIPIPPPSAGMTDGYGQSAQPLVHSLLLDECDNALYVAERIGLKVS